jgi:hypothetical protein
VSVILRAISSLALTVILVNILFIGIHTDTFSAESDTAHIVKISAPVSAQQVVHQPAHPKEPHNDRNGLHHCNVCQVFFPFTPFTIEPVEAFSGEPMFSIAQIPATPFLDGLIRPPIYLA